MSLDLASALPQTPLLGASAGATFAVTTGTPLLKIPANLTLVALVLIGPGRTELQSIQEAPSYLTTTRTVGAEGSLTRDWAPRSLPHLSTSEGNTGGAVTETARRALDAVEELTSWLGLTEDDVAKLAGFSRRSLPNWRRGMDVYPKTVRGLFQVHALTKSLVVGLGQDPASEWLRGVDVNGVPRLQGLATPEGRTALSRAAQAMLFERPLVEPGYAEFDAAEFDASFVSSTRPPDAARTPARGRRRPA